MPLCNYRCHFCQFPIQVLGRAPSATDSAAERWVDSNIAEASLWLARVPSLGRTPVGEFCLFGGTPTAIPMAQLRRLTEFYRENFNFTPETSLRAEGSPDTLTRPVLEGLFELGYRTLTYGIQSFDDGLLDLANRRHSGEQAADAIRFAREVGFKRVDGDLVWGLPGQSVAGFVADVRRMLELGFDTIVAIKLHLRSFHEVQTAIGHVKPAVWEDPEVRERIAAAGHHWPSLGEQFQMREAAVAVLDQAGYAEHPTTYFPAKGRGVGPEIWRSLNLDQHLQAPEVGIGLGGYSWSRRSEANIASSPQDYDRRLDAGEIPFVDVTGISPAHQAARAVRMALSTCQPLSEAEHSRRFPDSSLFDGALGETFARLQARGLVTIDQTAQTITLTPAGQTVVEAIMNTEIK